jgi:hypothetical protein
MAKNTDEMLTKIDSKLDEVSDAVYKIDKEVALQKAAFEDHMRQDEKMYEEFKRMNDILQQNTESLKEHMHRTALLENLVQKMDSRLSPLEVKHIEEEAVKKYRHDKLVKIGKAIGLIATLIGILVATKPFLLKLLMM